MAGLMVRPGVWAALAATALVDGCGHDPEAAVAAMRRRAAAWPESVRVGALVDDGGRRICSATQVAPAHLVTSARCAAVAARQPLGFVVGAEGAALATEPAAAVVRVAALAGSARPLAAVRRRNSARWAPAARRCHVEDVLDLRLTAVQRSCILDALEPEALAAAGLVGLDGWDDVAQVVLDQPLGPPAGECAAAATPAFLGLARLWVIGTRELAGNRLQRTCARWELVAEGAGELHARAAGSRLGVDVGASLWAEVVDGDDRIRLALVGVASRPFVAHGDSSVGTIFARLPTVVAATLSP